MAPSSAPLLTWSPIFLPPWGPAFLPALYPAALRSALPGILDSMKMPGQRSGFHICDISDLNNTDPKVGDGHNTQLTTNSQTTQSPASAHFNRHGFIGTGPYQLNSAMFSDPASHYHSMFPAAAKAWFQDNENYGSNDRGGRATSVPPLSPSALRASSVPPPRGGRATSLAPLDSFLSEYEPNTSSLSPTPVKSGRWGPRDSEVAYDTEGSPIYRSGWSPYNSLSNLFNPRPNMPISAFTRDPFWYDLGDLKPFSANIPSNNLPSYLRDSFLSPVKRNYLWPQHPVRPFAHVR